MEGCRKINTLVLHRIGVVMCVVLLLSSCALTCRVKRDVTYVDQILEVNPDTSQFVPLHPPVVVPKNWREVMQ